MGRGLACRFWIWGAYAMTQYEAEILAQFASTWKMLDHNTSLRACLKLDLESYLSEHLLDFDKVAYWNMVSSVQHGEK